jgi:CheY-like chemotaxis protein
MRSFMAIAPNGDTAAPLVLLFENDPRQAIAYRELFVDAGYPAQTALPEDDVQRLCERLQPAVILFDMAIWEADTAYVYGVLTNAVGFTRPLILALASLPHQVRRAKRFGADGVWIRGVDDAGGLPQLIAELLEQRQEGKLKPKTPATPL